MSKLNPINFKTQIGDADISIFFTCASFETRCFKVANILQDFSARKFIFYNENESSEIKKNAYKLKESLKDSSLVALNSDRPVDNFLKIDSILKELIDGLLAYPETEVSKPNILLDSTTFTHETLLVLVRLLAIKSEFLGHIYISYVGAQNYSTNTKSDDEKWLSKGIKEIRTVLGYGGITDPTRKNHLLILFGFESERTRKIIEEYEYDLITLGFSNSPILSSHQKINARRHKDLIKEYPNAKEVEFSLIDPETTKKEILEYLSGENYINANTVIAPLNNKLSTIGAGLAAIENQNIQIAYAKPNIYNIEGYSEACDDFYLLPLNFI